MTAGVVTLTNPGDQTNSEDDTVSLQLSSTDSNNSPLSYQASGLPSGLNINSVSGLISGTVASGDAANGPYTVTVMATDTQGNSSAQQFTWNVNALANSLTLTNPGNQSNAEGDNVSLQVAANDSDGDTLTYSASGLPIGLMIDPSSGLISGTVDYSAAEISGGQYNVTVTVNDGNGQTASQSFVWAIANTPRPPWLLYPTVQNGVAGTQASLQLVGGSPDGSNLTYSAQNLPPGLIVNATTGVISGQLNAQPGSSYQVTATVTDTSNLTASQTFTWQVTASATPRVILAINGTVDHSDDVGLVNPSVTIPLTITLQNAGPGMYTIQIGIPSGRSEVSQSQVELTNGGTTTIWLTPLQASQAPDDVDIQASVNGFLLADQVMTNVEVTLTTSGAAGHIRNADTPEGMADRIPPTGNVIVPTPVTVSFSQDLGAGEVLWLDLQGDGAAKGGDAANGTAWIMDGESTPKTHALKFEGPGFKGDYVVDLWGEGGTKQTQPGHAGKIFLTVGYGPGDDKIKSAGFSVAAIPIAVKMSDATARAGNYDLLNNEDPSNRELLVGATYNITYVSDSGRSSDLDQVKVSEKVVPERGGTGVATTWTITPSGWRPAVTEQPQNDAHGPRVEVPKTQAQFQRAALSRVAFQIFTNHPGERRIDQWFVFTDARTGTTNKATAPLVKNSGFLIVETATQEGNGRATVFSVGEEKSPNPEGGAQPGEMNDADKAVQRVRFNAPGFVVR